MGLPDLPAGGWLPPHVPERDWHFVTLCPS